MPAHHKSGNRRTSPVHRLQSWGNSVVELDTSSLAQSERLKLEIRWY